MSVWPGSVDFVCYDSVLSVAPIKLRSHRVAARSLPMWRIEAEKRDEALYWGKGDFGFAGPCPPFPPSPPSPPIASFTSNTSEWMSARVYVKERQKVGMRGSEKEWWRSIEGRLRNGSSDRDFNVEHTRFESIGPLRLAWEAVDMVQQLPLRLLTPRPPSRVFSSI